MDFSSYGKQHCHNLVEGMSLLLPVFIYMHQTPQNITAITELIPNWSGNGTVPGVDSLLIKLEPHGDIVTYADWTHTANCLIYSILISL